MTFDGMTWSAGTKVTDIVLNSVSCATETFCTAVGWGAGAFTFDGAGWSGPALAGRQVDSVSCPVTGFCVGPVDDTSVYVYTGSWGQGTPLSSSSRGLEGVSCSSATLCVAADWDGTVHRFNGVTWAQRATAMDSAAGLSAISCSAGLFCATIGAYGDAATSSDMTLEVCAPRRQAQLRLVCVDDLLRRGRLQRPRVHLRRRECVAADDDRGGGAHPTSVSCASPELCWAVDSMGGAVRFDGNGWQPRTDVVGWEQNGISCASIRFCVTAWGETWTDGVGWSDSRTWTSGTRSASPARQARSARSPTSSATSPSIAAAPGRSGHDH